MDPCTTRKDFPQESYGFRYTLFVVVVLLEFNMILSQSCKIPSYEEKGFALIGTSYRTIATTEYAWCLIECVEDLDCMSINYDSGTQKCDLNSQTKETMPHKFKKKEKSTYTKNTVNRVPKPLKGSKERPAKSCLDILVSNHSIGTGVYWLDPPNTGSPIQAYCDMDTDRGGWTTVSRYLVQNLPPPTNTKPYRTYDVIAVFNSTTNRIIPRSSAMLDILNKMGFHQIHFYCHKKSVGRVVSIMTKNSTAGQYVVQFFTDVNPIKTFPDACGTFEKLREDTSIVAQNCEKWGQDSSGNVQVSKWGFYPYSGSWRLHTPFSMQTSTSYVFSVGGSCDDSSSSPKPLSLLDIWRISVR